MVRDGISVMLNSQKKIYQYKIDEAANGEEAILKVQNKLYDVIIMDYNLPKMSGPEVVRKILSIHPDAKILALSNSDEYAYITNMIESGAKGFILKNTGPDELLKAIDTILSGTPYYSNEVSQKLLMHASLQRPNKKNKKEKPLLSEKEIEILTYLSKGMRTDKIAEIINLSKRTVDWHKYSMIDKLEAKNTSELIKIAITKGLIKAEDIK
jgi:DNA-binding NarL/FixJ family response regulator